MVMDDELRNRFLADPEEVSGEFDLTQEEIAELKKIDFSELEIVDNELEERLSKSFINLPDFSDEGDFHSSHSSHGSHDDNDPTPDTKPNSGGGGW